MKHDAAVGAHAKELFDIVACRMGLVECGPASPDCRFTVLW